MNKNRKPTILVAGIALTAIFFGSYRAGAADKSPMTLNQMIGIRSIREVALSPDGRTAAFSVTSVDWQENIFTQDIWLAGTDGKRCFPLTHGPDSNMSPAWTRDGKCLTFLSTRKGSPQVFLYKPGYGEPEMLFQSAGGVQRYAWSPDGRILAFLTPESPDVEQEKLRKQGRDATEADTAGPRSLLFLYDVEKKSIRPQAEVKGHIMGFSWSPDGSRLAFVSTPRNIEHVSWVDQTVWVVDKDGENPEALDFHYYEFLARTGLPLWSPDGSLLAMVAGDLDKPELYNPILQAYEFESMETVKLSGDNDQFMMDCTWSNDGRYIYCSSYRGQNLHLFRLEVETGRFEQISHHPAVDINAFAIAADGKSIVYSASTPGWPTELFFGTIDRIDQAKCFTDINPELRSTVILPTEEIVWQGEDGLTIYGNIVYPVGYEEGCTFPCITLIHGGPAGNFNNSFNANFFCPAQFYAGQGYVVYLPNVRGSIGWGSEFMRMNRNDWGGADYRDLMAGLDMLTAKGIADPDKLVVWGGSYGGYMTNWIVTQTDRFKAAQSEVSISDLVSLWSLSPIGRVLLGLYFDKTPIEDPSFFYKISPFAYASKVKTPLLLTQNEKDQRVGSSPGQAMEFYRALERTGVPVRLYVYPGEGHGTRIPIHQLDKLEKGFAWFEKYLGRSSGR